MCPRTINCTTIATREMHAAFCAANEHWERASRYLASCPRAVASCSYGILARAVNICTCAKIGNLNFLCANLRLSSSSVHDISTLFSQKVPF
mmetsp:Transcript_57239/g.170263  ORF Transcript_57239/g.170263 Transcript_57239/m.170263 type:complete len:92 (-) Transcript_57239:62-337(-)